MRASPRCAWVSAGAVFTALGLCNVSTAGADESSEPRKAMAEASVSGGLLSRQAEQNPSGIGYGLGLGIAVEGKAVLFPWLRLAIYYVRSSHAVDLPPGAAGVDHIALDAGDLFAFSLGARLEPTLELSERVALHLQAGVGWGRMTTPRMHVTEDNRSYTLKDRAGVFLEYPVGIGASFHILPQRLAVVYSSTVAFNTNQSGDLFSGVPFVDSNGQLDHVEGLPTVPFSTAHLLGISLLL